ncbi:hypothetical protein G4B11_000671 [Aspergillus flavus]|nr:hypothetical protein G4B11_000671 [Aspergillus flavus]
MSEHKYIFTVTMSCGGCSGAVERVLKKLPGRSCFSLPPLFPPHPLNLDQLTNSLLLGVKSYDVSLDSQTATVVTEPSVSYETVLVTIQKTGKTVTAGEADGQTMAV